ncbi:MAG: DUF2304 domain-containing protein, partial [Terrimesophilobacter sp.]
MIIQIILIVAILGIAFYFVRTTPSARHLALRRLLLSLALVCAIVVILAPGWLTAIAHFVGIGRGTDLLLYGLVVVFLMYAATEYKRTVQANRSITAIARELALTRAKLEDALKTTSKKE